MLLSFDFEITTLDALTDALAVDVDNCSFSRDNRLLDPYALLEACTCLITMAPLDNDYKVQLVHYTVKEYLMSERISCSPATVFQMSNDSAYFFAARCFITYMLDEEYDQLLSSSYKEFGTSLIYSALDNLALLLNGIKSAAARTTVAYLVLKLFDPNGSHFQKLLKCAEEIQQGGVDLDPFINRWAAHPGAERCVTLVYLCLFDCFEAAEILIENSSELIPFESQIKMVIAPSKWEELLADNKGSVDAATYFEDGTILHLAVLMGKFSFAEYLISKGSDVDARSAKGLSVLASAVSGGFFYTHPFRLMLVNILLANKANPNPLMVSITPLQAAILETPDYMIIAMLLASGADVNGVADDEATVFQIRYCHQMCLSQASRSDLERWGLDQQSQEDDIRNRGEQENYDTPLRIVESQREKHGRNGRSKSPLDEAEVKRLNDLKDLLKSYGGKSLHLFPVKGLPGYVEADMKAFYGNGEG
jgi:ankyrin repeat protein